jgi:hypothetical protein
MEALHIGILGWLAEADVYYVDLLLDRLGQEVPAGYFRTVVTANRLRFARSNGFQKPFAFALAKIVFVIWTIT